MSVRSFECRREELNESAFREWDISKEGHQYRCNIPTAERLKHLPKHHAYLKTLPCSCAKTVPRQVFKEKITGFNVVDGSFSSEWVQYK